MSRRARAQLIHVLALAVSFVALPALALANSGGAGLTSKPRKGGSSKKKSNSPVQPGNVTVSASGNGITIRSRVSGFLGSDLQFTGNIPSSDGGSAIQIQRNGHQTGWSWAATAQGKAGPHGGFKLVWHVNHIGRFAFRLVMKEHKGLGSASTSPSITVTVYKSSIATWYGPGFWGSTTACGEVLEPNTLGTANRTLPCGTKVALYYQGRTMVVPVIDRGPYANNADWDLTEAVANDLGTTEPGVATIWAVSLPRR